MEPGRRCGIRARLSRRHCPTARTRDHPAERRQAHSVGGVRRGSVGEPPTVEADQSRHCHWETGALQPFLREACRKGTPLGGRRRGYRPLAPCRGADYERPTVVCADIQHVSAVNTLGAFVRIVAGNKRARSSGSRRWTFRDHAGTGQRGTRRGGRPRGRRDAPAKGDHRLSLPARGHTLVRSVSRLTRRPDERSARASGLCPRPTSPARPRDMAGATCAHASRCCPARCSGGCGPDPARAFRQPTLSHGQSDRGARKGPLTGGRGHRIEQRWPF